MATRTFFQRQERGVRIEHNGLTLEVVINRVCRFPSSVSGLVDLTAFYEGQPPRKYTLEKLRYFQGDVPREASLTNEVKVRLLCFPKKRGRCAYLRYYMPKDAKVQVLRYDPLCEHH